MSELYNIDQALSLSREEVGENYKNHINPAMVNGKDVKIT